MKTYWYDSPRGFANEYEIGISTCKATRQWFGLMGYQRITRKRALAKMTYRGDAATEAFVSVRVDDLAECEPNRFETAKAILNGEF